MPSPIPNPFPKSLSSFQRVQLNDALVHRMVQSGASLEDIIVALVAQKETLLQKFAKLHAICPRKITLPDGRVMIWHCPDHLVPETI